MVYSVGEDIKGYRRDLDECFRVFMNSVTSFIAHQALLLRNDITEMRMRDEEKKANDALSQLPCADARGNSHNPCLEGTRMDILKHVAEWATDPGAKPIFCLVDQAGTGKSTISIHMAQTWERRGFTVARFFFSLPNSVTNGTDLATTFARDLGDCSPTLRSLILEAIDNHPNTTGRSIQEKLEWFVFTPLKRRRESYSDVLARIREGMLEKSYTKPLENLHHEICKIGDIKTLERSYRDALEQAGNEAGDEACSIALEKAYTAYAEELVKVYVEALVTPPIIVVDALDECSVVDRDIFLQSVLGFLEEAIRAGSHPIKLFITSRPEDDIISRIHDPCFNRLIREADFGMVLGKASSSDDDIALYARKYLDLILNSSEISRFVARAKGLFIWASTARAFLEDALDLSACFEDLISENTTVSPLNSLYDKILRSAMDRVGRHQLGPLKKVLQAICVAREPICVESMDELLGLNNGVALRVVKRLRSVLSDGIDGKVVQVLHPTFIEYFQACSQPDALMFSSGEAETKLASGCLNILCSGQLHYDICNIMRPDSFAPKNREIDDLQHRLEKSTTSGLRYAAVHGLTHVSSCLDDSAVLMKLQDFFETDLIYWIELMSLLGEMYRLRQSVHHLRSQIEDGLVHSNEFLTKGKNWCDEIQTMIHPFQAAVEESAMQIYFSALPFVPPTSDISQVYQGRFMDKIPRVLHAWNQRSQSIVLPGHTGRVECCSFSPGGQWLASGSTDKTIRLWDVTIGAAFGKPLAGHTADVSSLSFSPDGQQIASGSRDRTIRLWDVATGSSVREPLVGHISAVKCLSFSPDGQRLASGSKDRTIRLWDVATGEAVGEPLVGHSDSVECLSFSPDGRRLASGSEDRTIRLWDVATGEAVGEPLTGHRYGLLCLSFSPDSRRLTSASRDSTMRVWKDGTDVAVYKLPHCLGRVSFSPDGRWLVLSYDDGAVLMWNVMGGTVIRELQASDAHGLTCLSLSPDGQKFASGSGDGTVCLLDITAAAAVSERLPDHASWVICLSFSPDGRLLASGSNDATVRFWDITTGAAVGKPLSAYSHGVTHLSFSPDSRRIAGSDGKTLCLWDVTTGEVVGQPLAGHTRPIKCISFSPNGRQLASGSEDRTVRLWDVATGEAVGEPLTGHTHGLLCLSFSADSRKLASGAYGCTVRLWDVATGSSLGEPLVGHVDAIKCLSFSPDGELLASGSADLMIRLWDIAAGTTIIRPIQHHCNVQFLSFYIHHSSLLLVVNHTSTVLRLSGNAPSELRFMQQAPQLDSLLSLPPKFDNPWTYIQSPINLHFRPPSNFKCEVFLSHRGKLAYGGQDGSVIIIDCSHFI